MISRVPARLNCRFTYEGVSREAVVIDLSLNGAYLASKFLPPKGGCVTVTIRMPSSGNLLALEGAVVRGNSTMSDHGSLGRFGIRFNCRSLELIKLIAGLAGNR